jgi:DNA invertase Pin-like site-specific DNA recombinase
MRIGYARISTADREPELQTRALQAAGCERFFSDTASGADSDRTGLVEALAFVRSGDTLVVWKLDRMGRSLKHLIETVNALHGRGVGFISLQESIDTTTSGGNVIFHVFGALAEFERELMRERTQAGLRAARARGRQGGRPPKLDPQQVEFARTLMDNPETRVEDVCRTLRISRSTLYRHLDEAKKTA